MTNIFQSPSYTRLMTFAYMLFIHFLKGRMGFPPPQPLGGIRRSDHSGVVGRINQRHSLEVIAGLTTSSLFGNDAPVAVSLDLRLDVRNGGTEVTTVEAGSSLGTRKTITGHEVVKDSTLHAGTIRSGHCHSTKLQKIPEKLKFNLGNTPVRSLDCLIRVS